MNIVEINQLNLKYGGLKVLVDVSFSIAKNDFLGIIGPNGAGKTTLFLCMVRILNNYDGTIKFFNKDIKKSKEYLKYIGYVPQKPVFDKNFPITVREIVRLGLQQNNDALIDEILQQVWLHELSDRRIGELSGGQQQRVFIAKALVNKPKILILDEPVTGIDAQSTELFYDILRDLNKHNITIILSSHDLNAVNMLANKVACLNQTLFFHGISKDFFDNDNLVKKYSESSMQRHITHHKNDY